MQGLRPRCWGHCTPLSVTEGPVFLLVPRVLPLGPLGKGSLTQNFCRPKGSLSCKAPKQRTQRQVFPSSLLNCFCPFSGTTEFSPW